MSRVVKSIEVDIPLSIAFQEWMRFEALPRFMRGVVAVKQLDDRHLWWRAQVFGLEQVWELEIIDIVPGRVIAWSSYAGPRNRGAIMFEALSPFDTRVSVEMHYDPQGFLEEVTDYFGVLNRWVERSLICFKDLMERPNSILGRLPPAEELVGQ